MHDVRTSRAPRHGLARVLSKAGLCSRAQAAEWIRNGRVAVNGRIQRDPEFPTRAGVDRVELDGAAAGAGERIYLMLNKPRGLVTTVADERGRDTVYRCFEGAGLPWISPVGRLDQASEGLLLFCNDPAWAAGITDPAQALVKSYHVQVAGHPGEEQLRRMCEGVEDAGELLRALGIDRLRGGEKNCWLEVRLDEGRNRHIRRLLKASGFDVLRLVRVAIGPLRLGDLPKGQWRRLDAGEVAALATPGGPVGPPGRGAGTRP
jgi:23S rRNA pseudouridine2605 synthase